MAARLAAKRAGHVLRSHRCWPCWILGCAVVNSFGPDDFHLTCQITHASEGRGGELLASVDLRDSRPTVATLVFFPIGGLKANLPKVFDCRSSAWRITLQ